MSGAGYPCADAAADLRSVDLLEGWLAWTGGEWQRGGPDRLPQAGGFLGAALDSRAVETGNLFVGLTGEHVDGRDYVGAALDGGATAALTRPWDEPGAVLRMERTPSAPAVVLLSTQPEAALARLARCWRERLGTPTVAVTGSNGKTTTKDLLACLLGSAGSTHATSGNLNNDLGLPLTLLGLREGHRWAVLELGASAPGDIDRLAALAQPEVGVITNAAGAHLEGFGGLDGVVATKGELLDHLPADGAAVLDRDGHAYPAWRDRAPCSVLDWGVSEGPRRWSWRPDAAGGRVGLDGEVWSNPLPGRHNGANLVAAVIAARRLSGEDLDVASALMQFRGSEHRNRVLEAGGVTLLDDTYNANPGSVVAAARALLELPGQGRCFAVLGVMAELGPGSADLHAGTGETLRDLGLDAVWTIGREAAALSEAFGSAGRAVPDIATALEQVGPVLRPGDRLLVKGSRSARLERFVEGMLGRLEPEPRNPERS